jgi:hypothetical protein
MSTSRTPKDERERVVTARLRFLTHWEGSNYLLVAVGNALRDVFGVGRPEHPLSERPTGLTRSSGPASDALHHGQKVDARTPWPNERRGCAWRGRLLRPQPAAGPSQPL